MAHRGTVRTLDASAPKHVWTPGDRELLGVIQRLYDITNIEITQLFNTVNRTRLEQEGFRNGLRTTAISSQIADLKRTDRGGVFQDVLSMSASNVRNRFSVLILNIEQAAATLGIALPTRHGGSFSAVSLTRRLPKARLDEWATGSEASMSPPARNHVVVEVSAPKRRRIIATPSPSGSPAYISSSFAESQSPTTVSASTPDIDSDSTGTWKTDSDSDGGDEYLAITDNDFPATASRINPRLKISFNHKRRSARQRPRLLFRAFDPTHGLTARQFLHSSQIPTPSAKDSQEFRTMAFRHLSIDENFQSPFLSWTESAFRSLKLIAKSALSLSLAIIDYNVYEDAQEGRFGKDTGLWLVPHLCDIHGFTALEKLQEEPSTIAPRNRKGYTGIGEFLSWGSVTCDTIAILDTEAAMKLYQTMHCIQELSHESGVLVSQCLNDVLPIYREVVAYKLLRNFEVLRPSQGPSGASYETFVAGLYGTALADHFDIIIAESESGMITQGEINLSQQDPIIPSTSKGAITVEIPTKISSSPPDESFRPSVEAFSSDQGVLQSLIDIQLSITGEPYGIIIEKDDGSSSGEPNGKIQITSSPAELMKRHFEKPKETVYVQPQVLQLPKEDPLLKLKPDTQDNSGRDTFLYPTDKDELEDVFMKELLETAKISPPLPSNVDSIPMAKDYSEVSLQTIIEENTDVLETKPLKSPRRSQIKKRSLAKIDVSKLFDRHKASLSTRTEHIASTSATWPAHSDVPMANTRYSASIVDLTNDAGADVRSPRPKKRQTLFGPQGNAVDLTTDAGQETPHTTPSNTQSGAQEPNSIVNTIGTNDASLDLHEVLDVADDADVQYIGSATVHHRRRVRTTTHTVLTVRSRSVSESLTFAPQPGSKS